MSRRLAVPLVLAALALAAAPAGALADTLYAVPSDGSQTGPCTDPTVGCTLATTLTLASSGDTVVLAPGLYENTNSGSALRVPAGVTVQGAPGRLRPMIDQPSAYTSCGGCADVALGDGSSLQHVTVRQDPNGGGAISALASATIQDVIARGAQRALLVSSAGTSAGVVRDSVLSCTAASCRAVAVTAGAADLRNVTAVAPVTGGVALDTGGGSGSASLTGTNVIAQGTADDVSVHATHPATAAVTLHYSSFASSKVLRSGSGTTTFSGSDHQVAPAVLADPARGDFHEAPGSPTIDAGTTAVGPSGGDPDGHPRVIGAAPDVGAYEFQPAPGVTLGPVSGVTRTAATLGATVDPMGASTVVIVEWGPSPAYGFTLPVAPPGGGVGGVPVSATLSGLVPGATYHYRVVAFNDGGVSVTPDATVTTLPPPPAPPAASHRPAPHCVVPNVAGLTQGAASARLRRAHCRLGRVTRPRGHVRRRLVVVRQSPRRGARRPAGQRVAVTLGPPPRRRR